MIKLIRKHKISFKNAFAGLFWAFSSQPNFKVHFTLAALALLTGFYLRIPFSEMTILVLTIVLGLVVEMINTSIEAMTDLITLRWSKQAKIAKDVSAGMMLLAAIGAVLVAVLILSPHILKLLITDFEH